MKIIFAFLSLLISSFLYCQSNNQNHYLIKKYKNGNCKDSISYNQQNKLDGKSIHYNKAGLVDSFETFKNGKLDGLKKVFNYNSLNTFTYQFLNGKVIAFEAYNEEQGLLEKSPLDFTEIPSATMELKSGRKKLPRKFIDTVYFDFKGVPPAQRIIYSYCASIRKIDDNSYAIISAKACREKFIKLKVEIYGGTYAKKDNITRLVEFIIPIE